MPLPRGAAYILRSFVPGIGLRQGSSPKEATFQLFSSFHNPHILRQSIRQPIQRRFAHSPADEGFESILDRPATLVRTGVKHNPYGLAFLGI